MNDTTPVRIISLTAENVKRLKAVHIAPDPDGNLIIIGGRNAQGKSSVLDAIMFALAGKRAQKNTPRPVRDGEEKARVVVTLDNGLTVERRWTAAGGDALKVTAGTQRYSSPQDVLNAFIGELAFDPLSFAGLPAREQRDRLISVVELPFNPDELDREKEEIYQRRRDINRDAAALLAQAEAIHVPMDPTGWVDVSSVLEELRAARDRADKIAYLEKMTREQEAAIRQWETRLVEAQAGLEAEQARHTETMAELEAAQAGPDPQDDIDRLESAITHAEIINEGRRNFERRNELFDRHRDTVAEADRLTNQLAALDKQRSDGLEAATMPVPGLGFDDDGITYQGMPLSQCSSAEQLRISTAIAMALNPGLRVLRITDGSLLDADGLQMMRDLAAEHDFQIWMEVVSPEPGANVVIIEDGQVAA